MLNEALKRRLFKVSCHPLCNRLDPTKPYYREKDFMSTIDKKLASLNIQLPQAVAPAANYVPYVQSGNLVFISGQLPMKDGKPQDIGKVGKEFSIEQAQQTLRQEVSRTVRSESTRVNDLHRKLLADKLVADADIQSLRALERGLRTALERGRTAERTLTENEPRVAELRAQVLQRAHRLEVLLEHGAALDRD
jgi:hypothetical protein